MSNVFNSCVKKIPLTLRQILSPPMGIRVPRETNILKIFCNVIPGKYLALGYQGQRPFGTRLGREWPRWAGTILSEARRGPRPPGHSRQPVSIPRGSKLHLHIHVFISHFTCLLTSSTFSQSLKRVLTKPPYVNANNSPLTFFGSVFRNVDLDAIFEKKIGSFYFVLVSFGIFMKIVKAIYLVKVFRHIGRSL